MKVLIEPINPSNNFVPQNMLNQFVFRKTGLFVGKCSCEIADMKEPIWWNRPLLENTDSLLKLEDDGVYSFNFPLFSGVEWKAAYNVLLNKNNVPVATHLQFNHELTDNEINGLKSVIGHAAVSSLVEVGIPEDEIVFINNDVLLHGKKFMGGECIIRGNIYEENVFFTLKYKPEKEIFDRLKGHGKVEITGALEEFDINCTKEKFIKIYQKYLEKYLNEVIKDEDLVDGPELGDGGTF